MYRFIPVELSLPREERLAPSDFLKYIKEQYDRLAELSPLIPANVIRDFRKRFRHETDISKPEEANGLEKITVYPLNPDAKKELKLQLKAEKSMYKPEQLERLKTLYRTRGNTEDTDSQVVTVKEISELATS